MENKKPSKSSKLKKKKLQFKSTTKSTADDIISLADNIPGRQKLFLYVF